MDLRDMLLERRSSDSNNFGEKPGADRQLADLLVVTLDRHFLELPLDDPEDYRSLRNRLLAICQDRAKMTDAELFDMAIMLSAGGGYDVLRLASVLLEHLLLNAIAVAQKVIAVVVESERFTDCLLGSGFSVEGIEQIRSRALETGLKAKAFREWHEFGSKSEWLRPQEEVILDLKIMLTCVNQTMMAHSGMSHDPEEVIEDLEFFSALYLQAVGSYKQHVN